MSFDFRWQGPKEDLDADKVHIRAKDDRGDKIAFRMAELLVEHLKNQAPDEAECSVTGSGTTNEYGTLSLNGTANCSTNPAMKDMMRKERERRIMEGQPA
jgi:hypothetical protein